MSLRIEGISRQTLSRRALDRVTLEVGRGELLTLLGPAGSGRASLLRVIAGQEEPDQGRILLDGRDITRLPPRRRGIAHVFQQDPLFGHATVVDAVVAALPDSEETPEARGARARHLVALVGLAQDATWMPAMLPAAKRHRLALARALAAGPRVLLIGEGFGGAADPERNRQAGPRRWVQELTHRLGLTTILVAHGAAEALALGDRIAVMNAGRIEQAGTPEELRRRPASAFVAQALGAAAMVPAAPGWASPAAPATLPAEALEVVDAGHGMPARVLGVTALGASMRLDLQLLSDGSQVQAEMPSLGMATMLPPGTIIGLRVRPGPHGPLN